MICGDVISLLEMFITISVIDFNWLTIESGFVCFDMFDMNVVDMFVMSGDNCFIVARSNKMNTNIKLF